MVFPEIHQTIITLTCFQEYDFPAHISSHPKAESNSYYEAHK